MKNIIYFILSFVSQVALANPSPVIWQGTDAKFLNPGSIVVPGLIPGGLATIDSAGKFDNLQGTITGQVPQWNGTAWVPAVVSGTGTVTEITSNDGSIDITDPTSTPDLSVHFPMHAPTGGVTSGYCFDSDSCLYSPSDGVIRISTNNVQALEVTNNQQIVAANTVSATDFIYPSKAQKLFLASPNSGSGVPTFRAITLGDFPASAIPFPLNAGSSTAATPNYAFDSDTGMYSTGDGTLDFSTNAVKALEINNNQQAVFTSSVAATDFIYPVKSANTFLAGPTTGSPAVPTFRAIQPGDISNDDIPYPLSCGGSVSAPCYAFDSDSGFYQISDGVVGVATNGVERMRWENNGLVQIGGDLQIGGNISAANYPPTGSASTPAYFNGSGTLSSPSGWSYNAFLGTSSYQTIVVPADAGDVNFQMYTTETEINPVQDTTQYHPVIFNYDTHFDRTATGEDINDIKVFNASFSQEGNGNIGNLAYQNHGISLGNGTAGSLGGTGASNLWNDYLSINANYVATDLINFHNTTAQIDATATVGDFNFMSHGLSGNIGGNFQGWSLIHNGDLANGGTELNINHSGSLGNNYTIANFQHSGDSTSGVRGEVISIQASSITGNVEGQVIALPSATTNGKFAQNIFMGGGVTSGNSSIWSGDFQDGQYQSKLGLNINLGQSGGITDTIEKGINVQESVDGAPTFVGGTISGSNTATAGQWTGWEINSGTSSPTTGQVGLTINLSGSPEQTIPNRKVAANFDGGIVNSNYDTRTISSHPFTIDTLNGSRVVFSVDSGTPITGTDVGANVRSFWMNINDDIGVSFASLGESVNIDEFFLGVATGKTQQQATFYSLVPLIGGSSFGLPDGGTITQLSYIRPLAPLNLGATLTIDKLKVFHIDPALGPFSSAATDAWGFINEDSGLENFMGKLAIGTSDMKVTSGFLLDVDGPANFQQDVVAVQGVKLSTSGSQPTCDAAHRGLMWNVEGGTGVADDFQICQKDVADAYVWTSH